MAFIAQTNNGVAAPDLVIPNVPCDPTVIVGDWVRVNALNVVIKAIGDNLTNSNVLGLVESKSGSTLCNVRVLGVSSVSFVGLDATKEYYLSSTSAGTMTDIPPSSPGEVLLKVGQPYSSTQFLVLKGFRTVRA